MNQLPLSIVPTLLAMVGIVVLLLARALEDR
jgi:hypothetical protein